MDKIPAQQVGKKLNTPLRQCQPGCAAEYGEDHALHQQLAYHAAPPGPHRDSQRDLRSLAADRESKRFAKLAQVISSTSPATPRSTSSGRPNCLRKFEEPLPPGSTTTRARRKAAFRFSEPPSGTLATVALRNSGKIRSKFACACRSETRAANGPSCSTTNATAPAERRSRV